MVRSSDMNQRVRQVLTDSIGIDQGPEKAAWEKWLVDLSGYAYSAARSYDDQPTVVEQVPLSYQPQAQPLIVDQPIACRDDATAFLLRRRNSRANA